ncbi:MAG: DNA-directed DNA polymerase II small subunit [Nitrososphaeria archaeon]
MKELKLKELIAKMLMQGVQISPDSINLILKNENPIELMNQVIEKISTMREKPLIITPEIIIKLTGLEITNDELLPTIEDKIEIIFEPTNLILNKPPSNDFLEYFISRYNKIRKILITERFDAKGVINIKEISGNNRRSLAEKDTVKIICMINDKYVIDGTMVLNVEDLSGEISVIISSKNLDLIRKTQNLLINEVVCIEGKILSDGKILAIDILQPEVIKPPNNSEKEREQIFVVLTSDFHVGSRYFIRHAFNRFILWLNGMYGDKELKSLSKRVKYVIIAGDIVDGVGIYPKQEEELAIKDLKKQYEIAAKYLSQIPSNIKIILIPGNHDAARQALPSTSLFKEYAAALYELKNALIIGDPAYLKIHDSLFLITHGKSLDDVLVNVANLKYNTPAKAMIELLKRRHLAPIYGGRTQIAPEKEDYMVIEKIPHIFHAGHLHTFEYTYYKGITIVNSGAWQAQTEYMKKMGIIPDPAKVALINLENNLVHTIINFGGEKLEEG